MYDLSFGIYFLYTLCTKNGAICLVKFQTAETLGLIICFAIHFLCVNNTPKPRRPGENVYDLNFGMYFLYSWCAREWCNRFGLTPNCRDSRINDMFRNTFPMRDN